VRMRYVRAYAVCACVCGMCVRMRYVRAYAVCVCARACACVVVSCMCVCVCVHAHACVCGAEELLRARTDRALRRPTARPSRAPQGMRPQQQSCRSGPCRTCHPDVRVCCMLHVCCLLYAKYIVALRAVPLEGGVCRSGQGGESRSVACGWRCGGHHATYRINHTTSATARCATTHVKPTPRAVPSEAVVDGTVVPVVIGAVLGSSGQQTVVL
jgi:hypothetical protein